MVQGELDAETEAAMAAGRDAEDPARYGYQNTVCRVQDDLGAPVPDYVLEFDVDDKDSWDFLEMFHRDVIRSVHVYGDDPSYRSLYVDCTTLLRKIDRPDENVSVRFAASPDIDDNGRVGYDNEDTARILIPPRRLARIFHENRTLLIDVELKRLQRGVFRFPGSM